MYFNKGFSLLQESSRFEIAKQKERVYFALSSDGSWWLKEIVSPTESFPSDEQVHCVFMSRHWIKDLRRVLSHKISL